MSEKSLAGVRTPIWHALLILLIVVMAGELVLSGVIARKRFGAAPISETSEQHAPRSSIATGMSLGKASSRRVGQVAQPNKERAGA